MRRIFKFILITFILASCSLITSKKPSLIIKVKPSKPVEQPIMQLDTVPKLPKIKTVNWRIFIIPLINQLIQARGVELGKVLLINSTKNDTNMSVQSMAITDTIISIISNQNIFRLVPRDTIINARKVLGLSQEDSLVTRSKAVGLARYIQADYVLYSVISGNQEQSRIEMQLIEAQTGEILWSGINYFE